MRERLTHLIAPPRSRVGMGRKVRYAVVGLGNGTLNTISPAFKHAAKNSELAAIVSDDAAKMRALAAEHDVEHCFSYDDYELCLQSGEVDAVYIALPNNLHQNYCVRAAEAGLHVLCEKPLAVTEEECRTIIRACAEHKVKLMTAYRLHFERGNLEAIDIVRSGKIGEPRIFNSVFTQPIIKSENRPEAALGGGTLYDIGIYCINAARYIFNDEPIEGFCLSAAGDDPRFEEVEEMTSALLRFPKERLASFTSSFGASHTADFEVVGTKGRLRAAQAYDYSLPVVLEITVEGRTQRKFYPARDQFGPEIIYFSDCILHNREPEPSGFEGLRDVHIMRSLYKSISTRAPVKLEQMEETPNGKSDLQGAAKSKVVVPTSSR